MRHLSWGLTIFGAIGGLGLGAILAEADSFAGRADFGPANAFERRAAWGQGDAGHCRILNPTITIRKNGSASFSGQVALRWPRSFEQNFRIAKWIVGRG